MFFVYLKRLGRALWRCLCAIGRFFKFLFKKMARNSRTKKLAKKIEKNEAEIRDLYTTIGESYFAAHESDPEEGLSDLCSTVAADLAANEELRSDIDYIRETYAEEKAEAKQKAAARKAADKEKAQRDKARAESKKAGIEYTEPVEEKASEDAFDLPDETAEAFPVSDEMPAADGFAVEEVPEATAVPAAGEVLAEAVAAAEEILADDGPNAAGEMPVIADETSVAEVPAVSEQPVIEEVPVIEGEPSTAEMPAAGEEPAVEEDPAAAEDVPDVEVPPEEEVATAQGETSEETAAPAEEITAPDDTASDDAEGAPV